MTLSRRIGALQIVALVALLAMALLMGLGLRLAGDTVQRVDAAHRRLDALTGLQADVAGYLEASGAVLLLGRDQLEAVRQARVEIEVRLVRLSQATKDELAAITDKGELATRLPDLEDARRLTELFHTIDASTNRAFASQRGTDLSTAKQIFRDDVRFRTANELQPILDSGIDAERKEIARSLAAARASQQPLLLGAGGLAVLALAVLFVLGRAVMGQQAREAEAARARVQEDSEASTEQLRQANERLRSVDSRRTQFLADVSHQLRTPLTILRGEADVALRGKGDGAELRETLERIQGQARELGELLDELLTFARSEGENQELTLADARFDEIVTSAVEEAEVLAEPREITIVTTLGDRGCHLDADFRRLKQAVVIGLDNAIKHTAPGGRILVETAHRGDRVTVAVADEGPGISADEQPRVFERFFRGRAEDDMQLSGLGIGLAIAKDIVERHGGTIALDNRDGGGAVLMLSLPLAAGGAA